MPRPVDGVASLTQAQNALELVQTAQRLAALAALGQQADTKKSKAVERERVTREEEACGKSIRGDDQRRNRERRRKSGAPPAPSPREDAAPGIDIVV